MEIANKRDLIIVIDKTAEELNHKMDILQHLMVSLLEQKMDNRGIKQFFLPDCSSDEAKLKDALKEAIDVLEESRKAFKSKKLEVLRKKLTHILIETKR